MTTKQYNIDQMKIIHEQLVHLVHLKLISSTYDIWFLNIVVYFWLAPLKIDIRASKTTRPQTILIARAISAPQHSVRPIFPRPSRIPSRLTSILRSKEPFHVCARAGPTLNVVHACSNGAVKMLTERATREASELCTAGLSSSGRRRQCPPLILAP